MKQVYSNGINLKKIVEMVIGDMDKELLVYDKK